MTSCKLIPDSGCSFRTWQARPAGRTSGPRWLRTPTVICANTSYDLCDSRAQGLSGVWFFLSFAVAVGAMRRSLNESHVGYPYLLACLLAFSCWKGSMYAMYMYVGEVRAFFFFFFFLFPVDQLIRRLKSGLFVMWRTLEKFEV